MIIAVTAKEWTVRRMTDNEIIKALECCSTGETYADCEKNGCPLYLGITMGCKYIDKENQLYSDALGIINRQQAEIERLKAFKSYFDELYGKGLDVANWHLNSELESFDNFYESALQEVVGEE